MCAEDLLEFARTVESLEDKEYLVSTIAYSAAPTVEGKKPSTIVNLSKNRRNLFQLWQKHKADVTHGLGVSFFELRQNEEGILVLIYKPDLLEKYLLRKSSTSFLSSYGYHRGMSLEEHLEQLKLRYRRGCPHELGIFLGYPVKDVIGFIENRGKDCLLCRYWKVYHNPRRAMCVFDAYDKAKIKVAYAILDAYGIQEGKSMAVGLN
ncbi:MAG TPA: DUF3793 family protein [Clostridia bacterium]|nr:DUF3793 family protein [Clostridia bacterium]